MTDLLWNSSSYLTGLSESTDHSSSSCLRMEESDSLSNLNQIIDEPQGTELGPFENADIAFDFLDDAYDFIFEDFSTNVALPEQTSADSLVGDSLSFPVASTSVCQDIPNASNTEFEETLSSTVQPNSSENYELFPQLLFDPNSLYGNSDTFSQSTSANCQSQVGAISSCNNVNMEIPFDTNAIENFTDASSDATLQWDQDCKLFSQSLNQASFVKDQSQSYPKQPVSTQTDCMSLPRSSLVSAPFIAFQSHNAKQKVFSND